MNFNAFEPGVLIYTFYFFFLLLVTSLRYNRSNKSNQGWFLFFVFLQVLIGGLRSYTVGADTASYASSINSMALLSEDDIIEMRNGRDPYFYIFIKFVFRDIAGYTIPFFFFQILFWTCVSFIIYRYSKSCLLALIFFISLRINLFAFSGLRQATAMAFVFLSFHFIVKEKLYYFLATIFMASLCHESALYLLPIYYLKKISLYNRGDLLIGFLLLALVLTFMLPNYIGGSDFRYAVYFSNEGKMENLFSFIMNIFWFTLIHFNIRKIPITQNVKLLYNLSYIAFAISLMGINVSVASRVAVYFTMFMPIVASNIATQLKTKQNVVLLLLSIITFVYLLTGVPVGVDDYKFFWETNLLDYEINR